MSKRNGNSAYFSVDDGAMEQGELAINLIRQVHDRIAREEGPA